MQFRELTVAERDHLKQLRAQGRLNGQTVGRNLEVAFQHSGNFTTAMLLGCGTYLRVGTAKRNPIDKDNPLGGERLALARAARSHKVFSV